MNDLPLILLSGMGADERVFKEQKKVFPQLLVPKWIEPLSSNESLANYAKRFAEVIDPGVPCVIGGASFGGVVAQEIARHIDARACLLIGSVRSSQDFPTLVRWLAKVSWLTAFVPYGAGLAFAKALHRMLGRWMPVYARNLLAQAGSSNAAFYEWAVPALLRWQESSGEVPIFQIHGEKDSVLPVRYLTGTDVVVVSGGGHPISMRHGAEVNDWVADRLKQIAGG